VTEYTAGRFFAKRRATGFYRMRYAAQDVFTIHHPGSVRQCLFALLNVVVFLPVPENIAQSGAVRRQGPARSVIIMNGQSLSSTVPAGFV
jgi:hypothetical protein